jgi:hypothetical protein
MEIVYLSPAINIPIGGIKVIYRHSEMLNQAGFSSSVFHPENPKFVCDWFSHIARIRPSQTKWYRKKHEMYEATPFRPETDFLVIPEVWANQIGRQCLERNLKYAMFVQNGYQLFDGGRSDLELLNRVYENASVICSISEDTNKVIKMTFPTIDPNKIIRLYPHVSEIFRNPTAKKKKLITYMPRKLGKHAQLMEFFLRNHLPSDWSIQAIKNQNEAGVAAHLTQSAIFLSFCESEGCPLPPLEAALSGNLVVGYTGEGAKEYFQPPIFTPVHNGDFMEFVYQTQKAITAIEGGVRQTLGYQNQLKKISDNYSIANEIEHVKVFGVKASSLMI